MPDTTDHAREARSWLDTVNPDQASTRIAMAQAEATLALVEEQKTANLLAYLAIVESRGAHDRATDALDDQVRDRLALP